MGGERLLECGLGSKGEFGVSGELDELGLPADPAERMQQVLFGLYDLCDEAGEADFSQELLEQLHQVRLRFMDEFEQRFSGYGSGRALWR